jgi:hypothetical protein
MVRMLRTLSLALSLALANLVAFSAASAVGHTYSPSHYAAPCTSGYEDYNPRATAVRDGNGGPGDTGLYKKIQSIVYFDESLRPCSGGTALWHSRGWSLIAGVNGQGPTANTFAQLGIAARGCYGSDCVNGFSSGETDFWYTQYGDGSIYSAEWVDFDHDGRSCPRDCPIVGHTYEFSIELLYDSTHIRYCVSDLSSGGVTACGYSTRPQNPYYWDTAWWGFESINDATALGYGDAGTGYIKFTTLQYENYNGSIYSTVTNYGSTSCVWVINGDHYPANLTPPQHWGSQHCVLGGGSGNTTIEAYTVAHT